MLEARFSLSVELNFKFTKNCEVSCRITVACAGQPDLFIAKVANSLKQKFLLSVNATWTICKGE